MKNLKKEFEEIKKEISNVGFLEPYDPNKKKYIQSDASRSRLGYVLYQLEGKEKKLNRKM